MMKELNKANKRAFDADVTANRWRQEFNRVSLAFEGTAQRCTAKVISFL